MTQKDLGIRNVSLRILRDGPTHNHLLSPLTAYLAAVGPYEAVSVRMPYEHRRLLRDLNSLRYGATATRGPDPSRITAPDRRIIADDVGDIFAAVPGLTADIDSIDCAGRHDPRHPGRDWQELPLGSLAESAVRHRSTA